MANAVSVQVVERVESLTHDESSLCLCQVLSLGDEKEEFATLAKSTQKQIRSDKHGMMEWNNLR